MSPTNKIVVIIDDDDGVRHSVRFLLEFYGFVVHDFDSAASFLSECDIENVDCLILDQNMPETNGLALATQLRAFGSKMPIILITAVLDPEIIKHARDAGIYRVVRKPFPDDVFPEVILEAIAAGQ